MKLRSRAHHPAQIRGNPSASSARAYRCLAASIGGLLMMARWLCESEMVSLLVPVRPGGPGWLSLPAGADARRQDRTSPSAAQGRASVWDYSPLKQVI